MWKNKIFIVKVFTIIMLFILLFSTTKDKNNVLKEKELSLGTSSFREREINNYKNVLTYRYKSEQTKKQNKKFLCLKDIPFSFWENLSIPVASKSNENAFMNQGILDMAKCPQGLCFTEDYVLLTSYSDDIECLGAFLVFSRESGEHLITFGMNEESHLGGIAFDGSNVWICNSSSNTVERISYEFIKTMIAINKGKVINATNLVEVYPVENTPSCIAFYNNKLWIATHSKWFHSTMVSYCYNPENDQLNALEIYPIPSKVQGIAFSPKGEIYFSTSYGRRQSSYLKKYTSLSCLMHDLSKADLFLEMPPGSEGIDLFDNKIYILFESAGEKYYKGTDGNGTSLSPLDEILVISLSYL